MAKDLTKMIISGCFVVFAMSSGCHQPSENSQASSVEDHQSTSVFVTRGPNGKVSLRYVVSCANSRPKEYFDSEYVRAIESNTICEDVTIPVSNGEGFVGNFEDGIYGIGENDLIDKRLRLNANKKAGKIVSIEVRRWGLGTSFVTILKEQATYPCNANGECKSSDGERSIEVFDNRLVWKANGRKDQIMVKRQPIALPNGTFRSQQIPAQLTISNASPESIVINYSPEGISFVGETWTCEVAVGICSTSKAGKKWSLHLYDSSRQSESKAAGRKIAFARDGDVLVWHDVP